MKFGQNLHRYQLVEWDLFYIDYNRLKKLYKLALKLALERGEKADLTDFIAALKHNTLKAVSFYKARHAIIQQRVKALCQHFGLPENTTLDYVNKIDVEDLLAAFLDLRDAITRLQWYGLVNFSRILGRLGKYGQGISWPSKTDDLRIPNTQLMSQAACHRDLGFVNDWITRLRLGGCRGSTKTSLLQQEYFKDLPSLLLITATTVVGQNGPFNLDRTLEKFQDSSLSDDSVQQRLLFALLHSSILNGCSRSVERLLSSIESPLGFGDHLHWLVIKVGCRKRLRNREIQFQSLPQIMGLTATMDQLIQVIHRLGFMLKGFLHKADSFGRLPLHHAVQYGLSEVCEAILEYMKGYDSITSSSALLPDSEGLTALDIAVLTGNAAITDILLVDHCHSTRTGGLTGLPGKLLSTAFKLGSLTIVQLLGTLAVDIQYRDHNNETILYLAVRSGRLESVAAALDLSRQHGKLDLNATEAVYGWTPLILACVKGYSLIMDLLIRAGADPKVQDVFGWSAKDHAAFRGYLLMANVLLALESGCSRTSSLCNSLDTLERNIGKACPSLQYPAQVEQGIPPSSCQVLVNLGLLDTYKRVTAVDLGPYVAPDIYNPQREADFEVEIRVLNTNQSSGIIQLPILADLTNKPWRFLIDDAKDIRLAFNIFQAESVPNKEKQLIGSAIALLGNLKLGLGSKRESLIRDFTIPILHKDTLNFIGTITFYFIVITPFPHPTEGIANDILEDESTRIIGHRGVGLNDPSRRHLQVGENTLESFRSAIELGASCIEFGETSQELLTILILTSEDVQLTKDDVPIIYHDFLISETGIDAPLHNLSLEQFMHISEAQSSSADLPSLAEKRYTERCGDHVHAGYRTRSHSLNTYDQSQAKSLVERMKHTLEFKLNESTGFASYKGNIRGEYINASFMTLEDLFLKLSESVNFLMEIKYPMRSEAQDFAMDTYAIEMNHLVDTILDKVYRLAGTRTILLASFSPEICILLSTKQRVYPVLFLTVSDQTPSIDVRAGSLQQAVRFAKSWRLAGVISQSDPFVMSPALIRYVKDSGLMCGSWGGLNDDPAHAKTQADAGLDAIIVNSVKLIAQTLRQDQKK